MDLQETLYRMKSQNHWEYMLQNDVLILPEKKVLYAACSKNACSSLKKILASVKNDGIEHLDSPHDRKKTGLLGALDVEHHVLADAFYDADFFRFAFVRNPFDRIISCYKNRIADLGLEGYDKNPNSKNEFSRNRAKVIAWKKGVFEQDVDANEHVSFRDFLGFVCDQDPYEMDRHWYHQTRSIHFDHIDFDFIGRVENFNFDVNYLLNKIGAPKLRYDYEFKVNSSMPSKKAADYFDAEMEQAFVSKFEEDFVNFSYEHSLTDEGRSRVFLASTKSVDGIPSACASQSPTNLCFMVFSDGDIIQIRGVVQSIRESFGAEVGIDLYCRQTFDRYIADFCAMHGVRLSFFAKNTNLGVLYNRAVANAADDFLLFCSDGMRFTARSGVFNALSLLKEKACVELVGGTILEVDGGKHRWLNFADVILKDKDPCFLMLLPIEYTSLERFVWGSDYFVRCEVVQDFFLSSKSFMRTKSWDDELDDRAAMDDFCVRLSGDGSSGVVFYSGLFAEKDKPLKKVRRLAEDTSTAGVLMRKWGLSQFSVFGKFHLFFDSDTQEVSRLPFQYLDVLGNEVGYEIIQHYYKDIEKNKPHLYASDKSMLERRPPSAVCSKRFGGKNFPPERAFFYPLYIMLISPWLSDRHRKRLYTDPADFFGKANHPLVKFGKNFFGITVE